MLTRARRVALGAPFRRPDGLCRSQQEGLEKAVADSREKKRRLKATKITGDVNAERVEQLRTLSVKVPGSGGEGEALQGAKEVRASSVGRWDLGGYGVLRFDSFVFGRWGWGWSRDAFKV